MHDETEIPAATMICECCNMPFEEDDLEAHLLREIRKARGESVEKTRLMRQAQNERADALRELEDLKQFVVQVCENLTGKLAEL